MLPFSNVRNTWVLTRMLGLKSMCEKHISSSAILTFLVFLSSERLKGATRLVKSSFQILSLSDPFPL